MFGISNSHIPHPECATLAPPEPLPTLHPSALRSWLFWTASPGSPTPWFPFGFSQWEVPKGDCDRQDRRENSQAERVILTFLFHPITGWQWSCFSTSAMTFPLWPSPRLWLSPGSSSYPIFCLFGPRGSNDFWPQVVNRSKVLHHLLLAFINPVQTFVWSLFISPCETLLNCPIPVAICFLLDSDCYSLGNRTQKIGRQSYFL